jgi:anti-sigma factor RsiW
MTAMTTPNDTNDQDNITRYVLGDMTLDEQIEFEVRMAGDQELAREAATASAMDDLLRRGVSSHSGKSRGLCEGRPHGLPAT